jgi:hypothetical protein
MGAQTKLEVYGNREYLEVLRDEGIMLDLLSPGVSPVDPHGENRQIFDADEAGVVRVGIQGPKAKHHEGDPSTGLPQRALWPTANKGNKSAAWWAPMVEAALSGAKLIAERLAR